MDWFNYLSQFELIWPWALVLLPAPLLLLYKRRPASPKIIAPQLPIYETAIQAGFAQAPEHDDKKPWKAMLMFMAWCCLCFASARPVHIGEQIDIPLSGRDLMLAIDISPSMQEVDMPLNGEPATRLEVVKSVVSDFIEQREGDRIGLILFGSQPYIQAPLTFDTTTVNTLLQEAYLGMAGQATAIGDAIALGVKRLRQRPEQSRVLVLLSDGANTAGEIPPEKAAQLAQQEQIKIYTVGIGADEMLKRSFFGSRKVNPSADLDEDMLKQLAQLSGGQYFRARNLEQLQDIYELINSLEPVEQETRSFRPSKAHHHYLIVLAIALFFLCALIDGLVYQIKNYTLARAENTKA